MCPFFIESMLIDLKTRKLIWLYYIERLKLVCLAINKTEHAQKNGTYIENFEKILSKELMKTIEILENFPFLPNWPAGRTGLKRAERPSKMITSYILKTKSSVKIIQNVHFLKDYFQKISRASPSNPNFIKYILT